MPLPLSRRPQKGARLARASASKKIDASNRSSRRESQDLPEADDGKAALPRRRGSG